MNKNTIKEFVSMIPEEGFNKSQVAVLAIPVLIHVVDKFSDLAKDAMKNNYAFSLKYKDFEIKLKPEVATE